MSDLRTRNHIVAEVDADGKALVTRRWCLTNLSSRSLDMTWFRFFVEITSQDVVVDSFEDGGGSSLAATTETVTGGKTRINCDFDQILQSGQVYDLILTYRHPNYLTRFPASNAWLLAEYFQRRGSLEDVDFAEEDPQSVEFTLILTDPRPAFLGIRNPFVGWTTEATLQSRQESSRDKRTITYEVGLKPEDRSPDFHFLSLVSTRTLVSAVAIFIVTTVLSAAATWLLSVTFLS